MTDSDKISSRDRIFDVAVTLFARKGYAAVGVREIATEAEVNISMISYYFGGKIGILKDIIERFYTEYLDVLKRGTKNNLTLEEMSRGLISNIVDFFRSKPDFCKVGITVIPYNEPEVLKLKSEKVLLTKEFMFNNYFSKTGLAFDDTTWSIISPVLISSIYSHFLLGPVVQKIIGVEFDDAYYVRYINTITTFCLKGLIGVAEERKHSMEQQ